MFVQVCLCMFVYVCLFVCVWLFVCLFVCLFVYVCLSVCSVCVFVERDGESGLTLSVPNFENIFLV